MRLLVTGGAGFIGSNFVRHWLGRHPDDSVINLDALTYAGDRRSLVDVEQVHAGRYVFVKADIADMSAVSETLDRYQPQVIVNFAAESHNSRSVLDPARFVHTNVLGTQVLLEAARRAKVERFHHISTCEVYGDLPLDSPDLFNETSPYRPRTPYNASKAAADLLVGAYHQTYALPVTISNCSNNYGPYQFPEKLIPLFLTNALDDLALPLYRSSSHKREWLHVDDHCRAIEMIIERGRIGETYNVGSGEERSIEEVADSILAALGKSVALKRYVEDRPGHDRRYLLDHRRIERELGWTPKIRFAEGLATTIDWYRAHRDWWAPKKNMVLDESAWSQGAASPG